MDVSDLYVSSTCSVDILYSYILYEYIEVSKPIRPNATKVMAVPIAWQEQNEVVVTLAPALMPMRQPKMAATSPITAVTKPRVFELAPSDIHGVKPMSYGTDPLEHHLRKA